MVGVWVIVMECGRLSGSVGDWQGEWVTGRGVWLFGRGECS